MFIVTLVIQVGIILDIIANFTTKVNPLLLVSNFKAFYSKTIVRLMEKLEQRRQAKTQEQITEAAQFVATEIVDMINDDRPTPYSFPVGTRPKSLSSEEYISRVNEKVSRCLARVGMGHLISYDPESTKDANMVTIEATSHRSASFRYEVNDLTMVYDKT